jgi:FkbM family methyltransferase
MGVIIEVGANEGQDTEYFLKQNKPLYCFEPIPNHAKNLWDRFGKNPNFHLMTIAIDLENGFRKFNIEERADWGCSSLHDVAPDNPNGISYTTHIEKVMCMRLDTFLDLYGITEIDYLHIDTQGNDFRVLQSLGDKIDIVKEGAAEAAQNRKYYAVDDNTVDNVGSWLILKGFNIKVVDDGIGKEHTGAVPNGNEANIFFKRR